METNSLKILLIEDDKFLRKAASECFDASGESLRSLTDNLANPIVPRRAEA